MPSIQMTMRPVPSLFRCTLKLQLSNENCNRKQPPTSVVQFVPVLASETYLVRHVLVQHQREHLLAQLLVAALFVLAAVHEDVVLARVRVHVTVHQHADLVAQSLHHRLRVPDGRIRLAYDGPVLSVQILAGQ